MPRAKGTTFLHDREFVIARYGMEGWEKLLASMSASDRATIQSIVAVGWYEHSLQVRFLHAIDRTFGEGRGDFMTTLGRHAAEEDLTRIHRVFLRMANPAYVLEKAGEYWSRFYDTGTWKITRAAHGADAILAGAGVVDALWCKNVTAYVQRMFELVGAKDPIATHTRCRARGDEHCELTVRWK